MHRILVVGPGGAGKSTLAARIASVAGLPLVHLDALYWRAGWLPAEPSEWAQTVEGLCAEPRWVMDGNYGGTLDVRMAACEAIVFIDAPRWLCLVRVLRRRLRHRGVSRPSMPDGCPERLTLEFLWWIWTYPRRRRPALLSRLADAERRGKRVFVLRRRADEERFFSALNQGAAGV